MTITINPNRIELDEAYMQMAEVWAKRSKGNRTQVGALIVKDRQIISDGYNGMPAGDLDDVCEVEVTYDPTDPFEYGVGRTLQTKPEVLHAESNALMKIAKNGAVGAEGGTLYVTMSPCFECSKLIKQAGIKRVVFRNLYRQTAGIELLMKRGVQVEQLAPLATRQRDDVFTELRKTVPQQVQAPAPAPIPPVNIVGRPSEYKPTPPAPVAPPVAPPVLDVPIPKAPEPEIVEMSEAEIQAMIARAVASDLGAPVKKSTLAEPDDGAYRSPFL